MEEPGIRIVLLEPPTSPRFNVFEKAFNAANETIGKTLASEGVTPTCRMSFRQLQNYVPPPETLTSVDLSGGNDALRTCAILAAVVGTAWFIYGAINTLRKSREGR